MSIVCSSPVQNLRFVVYDVDDDSGDLGGQDSLGTAECRLAQVAGGAAGAREVIVGGGGAGDGGGGEGVHQVLAAPGHQLELQLSPYKTEPGDCGVLMVR